MVPRSGEPSGGRAVSLRGVSQATTGVKDLELALRRSQEHPNLEVDPALNVVGVACIVVIAGVHPTTAIVATPNFVNHVTSSRSATTSSCRGSLGPSRWQEDNPMSDAVAFEPRPALHELKARPAPAASCITRRP